MKKITFFDARPLLDIAEIRGRWHDHVYYVRNGKQCIRKIGNMTAERVKTDPCFKGSRFANDEFGAFGKLSATVRNGFGQMAHDVTKKLAQHNKLTQTWVRAFDNAPGIRGNRVLNSERLADSLNEFTWHKNSIKHLEYYGTAKSGLEPFSYKPKVEFGFFQRPQYPTWATHIRPVFQVVAISDLVRRKNQRKYRCTNRKLHGQSRRVNGPIFDLREPVTDMASWGTWTWRPDLVFPEAVEAGMSLIAAVGIECLNYNPDGTVDSSNFIAMKTVFTGKIPHSEMERHLLAEQKMNWQTMKGNLDHAQPQCPHTPRKSYQLMVTPKGLEWLEPNESVPIPHIAPKNESHPTPKGPT